MNTEKGQALPIDNKLVLIIFCSSIIVVAFSILIIAIWGSSRKKGEEEIINKANYLLGVWKIWSLAWVILDYSLSIFSFVASILAISIVAQDLDDTYIIVIYSTISATMVVINYATNPKKQAICYRKAFEALDYGLDCMNCKILTDKELADLIHKCEKEISKSYGSDESIGNICFDEKSKLQK